MDVHGKGTWNILAAARVGHRDVAIGFAGMIPRPAACTASYRTALGHVAQACALVECCPTKVCLDRSRA